MDKFDNAGGFPQHIAELQSLLEGMELVPMLNLLMKKFDLSLNQLGFASEIDVSALHKIFHGEHREFKASNVDSLLEELERLGKLTDPFEKEIWRRELRIAAFCHYDVYKAVGPRLIGTVNEEERKKIIREYLRSQYPILVDIYKKTQGQFPALVPIHLAIAARLLREHATSDISNTQFSRQQYLPPDLKKKLKGLKIIGYSGLPRSWFLGDELPALPALIEALKDEDEDIRLGAVYVLYEIGPDAKAAVPALIEALKDEASLIRCNAAGALGRMGPDARAAVAALIEALNDEDDDVRANSAGALGHIGPDAKTAVPALIEMLKREDMYVRHVTADALGGIGPDARAAVPTLIKALKDECTYVRCQSARALGKIGPDARAAVPALLEALKDKENNYFLNHIKQTLRWI